MIYPKLKAAIPQDDHSLILLFDDDEKRIYDFKPNLDHKVYETLNDINLFRKVYVTDGEIEWVTGQDFCPHTLYEQSTPMNRTVNPAISWSTCPKRAQRKGM
jgi:hypothetical protein